MSWREIVVDAVQRFVPDSVRAEVLAQLRLAGCVGVSPAPAPAPAPPLPAGTARVRRLEFDAVDLVEDRAALRSIFTAGWPAWRRWWLRAGDRSRPTLARCREEMARHLPELEPVWERLVSELAPSDPVAARFLSQFDPPAFISACSHIVVGAGGVEGGPRGAGNPGLIRNYDFDPTLFDGLVTRTHFLRRVVGTSDQVWGLLDGVNDAGLAASFTFGGRAVTGPGFGIPLVIRYLLETCETVAEAVVVLRRVPVHLPYNVTVLDAGGDRATVYVGPDRSASVTRSPVTTNHQETVDWPEHSTRFGSETRLATLTELVRRQADPDGVDRATAVQCMLTAPMRAESYDEGFGTLYTAVLLPGAGTVEYHWPGSVWALSLDDFRVGRHVVDVPERMSGSASHELTHAWTRQSTYAWTDESTYAWTERGTDARPWQTRWAPATS